ncbi:MAG TPA: hypothetical protein VHE99_06875 [Gammaproteobacteria bacterium]|nr:hypothetical protein [Gammaproteobacteria bacterium]
MNSTPETPPPAPTSPETRGNRVRHIRQTLLRYTRRKFSQRFGIPAPTLQNWETGKYGGLTEKGALKLVAAFKEDGVPCSVEWLLYGIGVQPGGALQQTTHTDLPTSRAVAQELGLFRKLHPNTVDAILADDSMQPYLRPGDLVAGERYFGTELSKAIDELCIIQLTSGEVLIRKFQNGQQPDQYILSCLDPKTQTQTQTLSADTVFSVAPIVWIRRITKL